MHPNLMYSSCNKCVLWHVAIIGYASSCNSLTSCLRDLILSTLSHLIYHPELSHVTLEPQSQDLLRNNNLTHATAAKHTLFTRKYSNGRRYIFFNH